MCGHFAAHGDIRTPGEGAGLDEFEFSYAFSTRPAALQQVPVSIPGHPFGVGEMAVEGLPRSIRFAVWVDMQNDPRDLAPVGTFRIRIEHAHVGDGMVIVVRGEFGNEGREIATSGLRGGMEVSCLGKAEALPPRVSRSWTPFSSELLIRLLFCS